MSDRSKLINRLRTNRDSRAAYIRAKLDVLIPSQLRALRLRQDLTQSALAAEADMKQSRISAMETPGKTNFNLETLVSLAATFKVGLIVKFVPFSGMLRWENEFSQDGFDVTTLDNDSRFLNLTAPPVVGQVQVTSADFNSVLSTGPNLSEQFKITIPSQEYSTNVAAIVTTVRHQSVAA